MRSAFCARVCACARRPADSGTSAECLPFPQSFDVTRSRCDNEPRAPPQGEHPAVRPGLCQSSGSNAQTHTHNLQAQQRRSRIRHSELFDFHRALGWRETKRIVGNPNIYAQYGRTTRPTAPIDIRNLPRCTVGILKYGPCMQNFKQITFIFSK